VKVFLGRQKSRAGLQSLEKQVETAFRLSGCRETSEHIRRQMARKLGNLVSGEKTNWRSPTGMSEGERKSLWIVGNVQEEHL